MVLELTFFEDSVNGLCRVVIILCNLPRRPARQEMPTPRQSRVRESEYSHIFSPSLAPQLTSRCLFMSTRGSQKDLGKPRVLKRPSTRTMECKMDDLDER